LKVYTKRGDDGHTDLWHGGRVPKDDARTEAYGTVDEAVSALGLARAELDGEWAHAVLTTQRELFALNGQLATDHTKWDRLDVGVSRVDEHMVRRLERAIDDVTDRHTMPTEFVVPGGNRAAAALDLARTIVRRAERAVVRMERAGLLPDPAPLHYLNRLSDYVYVLARAVEGEHVPSRPR